MENAENAAAFEQTTDSEEQDQLEGNSIQSVAYARINGTHLDNQPISKIAQKLSVENEPHLVPLFAYRVRSFLKLVYKQSTDRDTACGNNLYVDGIPINPEMPFSQNGKTLYLHGLPINETHSSVEKWLKDSMGVSLVDGSSFRWITYQDTQIRTGGRSCLVRVPYGTEIPGFATYRSATVRKGVTVHIWYRGSPVFCKRCFAKGHKMFECTMGKWTQKPVPQPSSYPAVEMSHVDPVLSPLENPDNFPPIGTELQPPSKPKPQIPQPHFQADKELDEQYGDKIIGFFTKESPFSNHHWCTFKIGDIKYTSTEEYLFRQKAYEAKDFSSRHAIIQAGGNAARIKKIGDKILWPAGIDNWRERAKQLLYESNVQKYYQNQHLREELFKTHGYRLAECSIKRFWGVGLGLGNPKHKQRANWTGANTFGDMLTKLRDSMMREPQFEEDVRMAKEGRKRLLSRSSDTTSPLNKHPPQ